MANREPDTSIVCVGHGSIYRFVLPSFLVDPDGAPIAEVEVGHAATIVTEVDAAGRLVELARWVSIDPEAATEP